MFSPIFSTTIHSTIIVTMLEKKRYLVIAFLLSLIVIAAAHTTEHVNGLIKQRIHDSFSETVKLYNCNTDGLTVQECIEPLYMKW